jgi:hypothetical protein
MARHQDRSRSSRFSLLVALVSLFRVVSLALTVVRVTPPRQSSVGLLHAADPSTPAGRALYDA